MVASVLLALSACGTTETRSCTWTGPDGQSQSVVAVTSSRTDVDAAQIEALAGIVRSTLAGTMAGPGMASKAHGAPPPQLPALCVRMFEGKT